MEAGRREQKCACNLQQEESKADFYERCARDTFYVSLSYEEINVQINTLTILRCSPVKK